MPLTHVTAFVTSAFMWHAVTSALKWKHLSHLPSSSWVIPEPKKSAIHSLQITYFYGNILCIIVTSAAAASFSSVFFAFHSPCQLHLTTYQAWISFSPANLMCYCGTSNAPHDPLYQRDQCCHNHSVSSPNLPGPVSSSELPHPPGSNKWCRAQETVHTRSWCCVVWPILWASATHLIHQKNNYFLSLISIIRIKFRFTALISLSHKIFIISEWWYCNCVRY